MSTPPPETPRLFRDDVARIWSEHSGREISAETVSSYIRKSRPADPTTGREAGRYADDPLPAPLYRGNVPYWVPNDDYPTLDALVRTFIDWWDRRRGRIGDDRSTGDRDARGRRT